MPTTITAGRSRVLEAAADVFADLGFHGTTTRDIALRAGLSPAALYAHFRSKEEALFEVTRLGHEAVLSLMQEASSSEVSPPARLYAVTRDFVDWHATNHRRARAINYDLSALAPEHFAVINAMRHEIKGVFVRIIQAGVDGGTMMATDPELEATAMISLGVDLGRWYHSDGSWTPVMIADRYANLALDLVGASREGAIREPH
jgi:AcrR family transcriptional regulator